MRKTMKILENCAAEVVKSKEYYRAMRKLGAINDEELEDIFSEHNYIFDKLGEMHAELRKNRITR